MLGLKIIIPANKKYLKYIDKTIFEYLTEFNVAKTKKTHFALHEIIINSIQAAENCELDIENKNIIIKLELYTDIIKVWVIDPFGGIDHDKEEILETQKDATKSLDSFNGRGILLIDHLVDKYEWVIKDNNDFEVYFEMNLRGSYD
ncbi:MAG: ATP-binding protein [Bacillota bacterium]|nr:ATP-binding protein [Bacillota bacterium]